MPAKENNHGGTEDHRAALPYLEVFSVVLRDSVVCFFDARVDLQSAVDVHREVLFFVLPFFCQILI